MARFITATNAMLVVAALTTSIDAKSSDGGVSVSHTTTYVHRTQDERAKTRWTLTEWLRIQERIKLMDLWLGIVSSNDQDQAKVKRLRLDISLQHRIQKGNFYVDGDRHEAGSIFMASHSRGQVYLSNVLHSMAGFSLLNIDFGGEYYRRLSDKIEIDPRRSAPDLANWQTSYGGLPENRHFSLSYYSGNMRLLGDHVQDSSLVFKYGKYQLESDLPYGFSADLDTYQEGTVMGLELQVYLTKAIGLDFNYLGLSPDYPKELDNSISGVMMDYGLFFEVSFVRLAISSYQAYWTHEGGEGRFLVKERGYLAGLNIQL